MGKDNKIACRFPSVLGSALAISGQFKVVRVYDGDTFKAVGHDIVVFGVASGIVNIVT